MDLPQDQALLWLVRRYADLLVRLGSPTHPPKLVLPTPEFFPDTFDGDPGSLNLLFWRLQEHASLTELDLELRFVDDGASSGGCGGGCGDGGCGGGCGDSCSCKDKGHGGGDHACKCGGKHTSGPSLADIQPLADGALRIDVRRSDARNATSLTSAMATSLAHAVLMTRGALDEWPEPEHMPTCELAAVQLGFGVLLANGSYQYAKACHGVSITRGTSLDVSELAVALALFNTMHHVPHARAVAQLEPTQRDAYSEAKLWVESNAKLVRRLERDPASVRADDHLTIEPSRTWIARMLGLGAKKKKSVDLHDDEDLAALEAQLAARTAAKPKSEQDARALKEIRDLVDESLREVQAESSNAD